MVKYLPSTYETLGSVLGSTEWSGVSRSYGSCNGHFHGWEGKDFNSNSGRSAVWKRGPCQDSQAGLGAQQDELVADTKQDPQYPLSQPQYNDHHATLPLISQGAIVFKDRTVWAVSEFGHGMAHRALEET